MIMLQPDTKHFNYFVYIEKQGKVKCRISLYCGITSMSYYADFFSTMQWRSDNELVIGGKAKQVEILIMVDECVALFKNLTTYDLAPYFQMMRADISNDEKLKADEDWLHSLHPAHAAIIGDALN